MEYLNILPQLEIPGNVPHVKPEDVASFVKDLPDSLSRKYGVDVSEGGLSEDEFRLISHFRKQYLNMSYWLDFLLSDNNSLLPILRFTEAADYEAFADIALNFRRLASQVIKRFSLQEDKLTATTWMCFCQIEICQYELENSGFFGQPALTSKTQFYKKFVDHCNFLENIKAKNFIGRETPKNISWLDALYHTAIYINTIDDGFKSIFSDYLASQKRCIRRIRTNKRFKSAALIAGKLQVLEKGQGKRKC